MKTLKAELFTDRHAQNELIEFVEKNNIQREDIFAITQAGASYTIFYYA